MKKIYLFLLALVACTSQMNATEGALAGRFTINAEGNQVVFSLGNLQYQASTQTWQFAAKQHNLIGTANTHISDDYSGWIDLFGWGTGNHPTEHRPHSEYYGKFADWGANAILNGGNEANMWRTLTTEEWSFLFCGRTNAAKLFGMGSVNGVKGAILLPDNWSGNLFTDTENGLSDRDGWYKNLDGTNFTFHTYSAAQWEIMEANGAVFLPVTGYRIDAEVAQTEEYGNYWSATPSEENDAYLLYFDGTDVTPAEIDVRYYGEAVRLVKDVNTTAIENIQGDDLQCTKTIRDGMLVIERNGKEYTVTGTVY